MDWSRAANAFVRTWGDALTAGRTVAAAALLPACFVVAGGTSVSAAPTIRPVASDLFPELFVWTDTCNVYVLKNGDRALLINFGDGSVLDQLAAIGIKRVDWILLTDHHREQSQGLARFETPPARIAAPDAERRFLEDPTSFRKMKPRLGDAHTVHSSSYLRPPVEPVVLDRTFSRMDTFTWGDREFWCVETRGNSPGSMSYLVKVQGRWCAFSGDLMTEDARMQTYFDTEWDYGFASGIYALHNSAALLESFRPALLLPSHGSVSRTPVPQLREFQGKLRHLAGMLVRGYEEGRFADADQDRVSTPTDVPYVWRITPHLYKFKGPNMHVNFSMLLADSGHALVVDCGLFDEAFLDRSLTRMKEQLGLKQIDAVLISHMHGDHFLEAPHLRTKWGAKIWALDRMIDRIERPERYDYAAPIQAYDRGFDHVKIDRVLQSGETFRWEDFELTADWMPGQTEFAMGLHGTIDGKKVVFTGDNIFAHAGAEEQTGHEAMVARNSGILEEGYIYGAEFLRRLRPDLIVGGHSYVMPEPAGLIARYQRWAYEMRDAFQSLSNDDDYRYWFDPFWVRADPYRTTVKRGGAAEVLVHIRNFREREQKHSVTIHLPRGLTAEPPVIEGTLPPSSRGAFPLLVRATDSARTGVNIVAFDITLDTRRYGELFDFIVQVD